LSAVAMATLAVAPALVPYLIAMAVFGLGSGLLDVAPAAVVGDIAPERAGTLVAAYQMAGDGGAVVGPLIAGRLADSAGYGAAFGATAGMLAFAALLSLRMPETRRAEQ
ncbi:MAG: MFS transporter, partial [Frankia sp.]|nr:MFS transporter [Frankia sp.]